MKLEHSFDVKAPIDRVWETLIDIERVAPCLPGAEITGHDDEGVYSGNFQVKLGPTTAAYAGKLKMAEVDEGSHRVVMDANGRDKRGQGSAKATIVSTMSESSGTTHVEVVTDFSLTGKLARFGRGGMIEDISDRLVGRFVDCLKDTVEGEPESAGEPAADPGSAEAPTSAARSGEQGTAEGTVPGAPASPDDVAPASGAAPGGATGGTPASGGATSKPAPRPAAKPAEPVKGFSLLFSVLWGRVKRLFARLTGRGA